MFSELVDRAAGLAGRPSDYEDFAYFANETMRDISKASDWDDDSCEAEVAVSSTATATIWTPPGGINLFRREEFIIDGCGCSPVRVTPDKRMLKKRAFHYYRSGESFVFLRACNPIRIYYYRYQPWLVYYPVNSRPNVYDFEQQRWDTPDRSNIPLVSNWMLERHNIVVLHGTLSLYFATKQDPRQEKHYAQYKQGLRQIRAAESPRELQTRG